MQDFRRLHNKEGRILFLFPLRACKIVEFYGRLWTCCCGWNYKHVGSFVVIIIGDVMDFSLLAKMCCCHLASVLCLLAGVFRAGIPHLGFLGLDFSPSHPLSPPTTPGCANLALGTPRGGACPPLE